MDPKPNFFREAPTTVGWISRKNLAFRSRPKFFLDIPFYRTVGWISRKNLAFRSRPKFFLDIPFYRTH